MRRSPIVLFLVIVFVALAPRPAAADVDWWKWWDGLSGPGPFGGVGGDVPLTTRGLRRNGAAQDKPGFFFDPSGLAADPTKPHAKVGVEWAILFAHENNLPYAPPRDQNPPGVHAFSILVGVDVGPLGRRGIEVGAGIGGVRFAGDGFGFTRFVLNPRLTLTPGLLFAKKSDTNKKLELVQIRIGLTGIIGEITAGDFGAIGTFRGGNEWLPASTVSINLLALLR